MDHRRFRQSEPLTQPDRAMPSVFAVLTLETLIQAQRQEYVLPIEHAVCSCALIRDPMWGPDFAACHRPLGKSRLKFEFVSDPS